MNKLMDTLLEYLWVVDFSTLCLLAIFAFKHRQNNSSLLTVAFVTIISGTIIKYQGLVNGFTDPHSSQSTPILWLLGFAFYDVVMISLILVFYKSVVSQQAKLLRIGFVGLAALMMVNLVYVQFAPMLFDVEGPSYKLWVIMAFYFGVALLDGFAVYAIYKLHSLFNLTHSLIARMYMLAFAVASLLQIVGFSIKYFWQSKFFDETYQISLAGINIGTSIVAMLIAVLAVYQILNKKDREGILWRV